MVEKFLTTKPVWRDRFPNSPLILLGIDVFLNGFLFGAGAALPLGVVLWLVQN